MAPKNRRKFNTCPNCAYSFQGIDNYCPNCGQENHNLNVPFKHIFMEVLEGTLHFDTKVFHTVKLLLLQPGQLTKYFVQNKRANFVPPIRLYVFISFIYFLVQAMDFLHEPDAKEKVGTPDRTETSTAPENNKNNDPVSVEGFGKIKDKEQLARIAAMTDVQIDSVKKVHKMNQAFFTPDAVRKFAKYLSFSPEEQSHKRQKYFSLMMFLLMPILGLIIQSAFRRSDRNYIQHLIFSVHFHCFAFILFTVSTLTTAVLGWDWLDSVAQIIICMYLFLALRNLYNQSAVKTVLKTIYIALTYTIAIGISVLIAIGLSILLS